MTAQETDELELRDTDQLVKDVDAEVKRIADLFRFILTYREQFEPSGVEFSNLRQYFPSDDAKRIDWKASARSDDLYVKEYDVEQDTDTCILLDVSDSMTFGTADKLKSEYAAVMAATLAYASVDIGLKVGLGMYGDNKKFITPKKGQSQYQLILREVVKQENYGGRMDLDQALQDAIGNLKKNTTIFLISDFIDVGDDWKDTLKLSNSKFKHFLATMVRDLRDYKLPNSGNIRFESPDGASETVINSTRVKDRYKEEVEKQEDEIREKMRESGANFLKIDTRDSFAAEYASYFDQEEVEW